MLSETQSDCFLVGVRAVPQQLRLYSRRRPYKPNLTSVSLLVLD